MNPASLARLLLLSAESVLRRPTGPPRDEPRERHQGRPGERAFDQASLGTCRPANFLNNAIILSSERAEEVSAAAQDQVRNLQQSGGHDEEAEKEVEGREQEWTGHGQRAEEYADPRGREV